MERHKVGIEYILFTSSNFPAGGPSASYLNLFCKGVTENGGQISVNLYKGYTYKNFKSQASRKNITDYGVIFRNLGFVNRPRNKVLKIIDDLFSLIRITGLIFALIPKRKKITLLVYSNDLLPNIPVYLLSKLFRMRLASFVSECYDKEELKKKGLVPLIRWNLFSIKYRYLNKLSAKLIVFSTYLKNDYIENGYDERNIILQPNLTNLCDWSIPGSTEKYTIGYAGTPSKKDGIRDLISSIKLLKDRQHIVKVIIIGDSTGTDSYIPALRKQCEKLGIADQILFTGLIPQEDVKKHLNQCRILAITRPDTKQTRAGFPTKLGEYMACKKTVLATRFGDIERYFTDKTDIVLAEPENPASIADSIEWILRNREKAAAIGQQGFQTANEVLDYKKGAQKIVNGIIYTK